VTFLRTKRLPALGVLVGCVAVLAIMMASASGAQAEERHFCYGANVAANQWCGSGDWNMNSAYANSTEGRVCLDLYAGEHLYGCSSHANEGIYFGTGCATGHASINNPNGFGIKVYGVFWTC
jgi:hypothetical protein